MDWLLVYVALQRIGAYQRLFSTAYAAGLNIQMADSPVRNISCAGATVFTESPPVTQQFISISPASPSAATAGTAADNMEQAPVEAAPAAAVPAAAALATGPEAAGSATVGPAAATMLPHTQQRTVIYADRVRSKIIGPSRLLLQQFFRAHPTSVDVSTVFHVPDTSVTATERIGLVEKLVSQTSHILDAPLSQFFYVTEVMVKAVELLKQEVLPAAAGQETASPEQALSAGQLAGGVSLQQLQKQQQGLAARAAALAADLLGAVEQSNGTSLQDELGQQAQQAQHGLLGPNLWDNTGGVHTFGNYKSVPPCPFQPSKTNSVSDMQGRFWSWNNGVECVFRTPAIPGGQQPTAKPVKMDWETAVTCDDAPNERNSVVDDNGRLWGWQNDTSCAFRQWGKGSKPENKPSAKREPAGSFKEMQENLPGRVSTVWESAPTCSFAPTDANAVPDTFGRLWGWENDGSCVFRVS